MCKKEEYNNEPVFYCKECLSLNIKELSGSGLQVCLECGTAVQEETKIDEYERIYKERYGKKFLDQEFSSGILSEKNIDIRK